MSLRRTIEVGASPRGLAVLVLAVLAVLGLPPMGGGSGSGGAGPASALAAAAAPAAEDGHAAGTGEEKPASTVVSPFLKVSGKFILALLSFSMVFAVLRLIQGPTLADRVIALDFIGVVCASMIGVYSIVVEQPLYLRAAIVLSLVSFLGTIGFALYCEKRGEP